MKRGRKWIRLDTDYADSPWLAELDGDVRRLWPDLLCLIKAHGTSGTWRAFTPRGLAKKLDTSEKNAAEFIRAAMEGGGIMATEDGGWRVPNWVEHQDPQAGNAARQQRFRDRKRSTK